MERTRSRAPRHTCCPAWDSSLAGASLVCLTCTPASVLRTEGSVQSVTKVPGPRTATAKDCRAGDRRRRHLNSGPPCSSPESKPSSDRVPVPTLVVTVTSLFPTSQVLVLPPARRNSPTGDLRGQQRQPTDTSAARGSHNRHLGFKGVWTAAWGALRGVGPYHTHEAWPGPAWPADTTAKYGHRSGARR